MRGFFRRWKVGLQSLTPLQLLRAKRVAYAGQVVGIVLVMLVLVSQGLSYWVLFLFFVLVLLFVELVRTQRQIWRIESYG